MAQACVIDCPEMADLANNELRAVKAAIVNVTKMRSGFVEPANEIIDRAKELFKPTLDGLAAAEAHYKRLLTDWTQELERRAAEEKRAREAAEREARQKAEREAAAINAKAEEQERAERQKAEEAEAARQKAIAEGNAKEAARQAEVAAKATERASAAIENADAKVTEVRLAAQTATAPAPAVAVPAAPKGFGVRKNFKLRLRSGKSEQDAVIAIAHSIVAGRKELASLLMLDMKACHALAKALEANTDVPCMEAFNDPIAASRSK
jgi:hypothetical protein